MDETVRIVIDGEIVEARREWTVAAALWNSGRCGILRSLRGEPRGALCGMGICQECRAEVDGRKHVRTCMVMCQEGMEVRTDG